MKRITGLTLAIGATLTTGAFGQSSNPYSGSSNFFVDGFVDLSYSNEAFGSGDLTLLRGDVDMGFLPPNSGGIGLGFTLGIDGFWLDDGSSIDEVAFFPAVVIGTQIGNFSVGSPRSVIDRGYLSEHRFASSSIYDIEVGLASGSFVRTFTLLADEQPLGLRYDGEFGALRAGLSYHNLDVGGPSVDVWGLAFSYGEESPSSSFLSWLFFGGVEHLVDGSNNETSYFVGVEGGTDRWTTGIEFSDAAFFGGRITEGYFDYYINDLTLGASVAVVDDSGSGGTLYGLSAKYRFLNNGYVDLSYIDSDESGDNAIWEASIGWYF